MLARSTCWPAQLITQSQAPDGPDSPSAAFPLVDESVVTAAERLRTAAAAPVIPEPVLLAHSSVDTVPSRGQVWRVRWEDTVELVIVLGATDTTVSAAPVTEDLDYADEATVILPAAECPLEEDLAVWLGLQCDLPTQVLDRTFGVASQAWCDVALGGGDLAAERGTGLALGTDLRHQYRAQLKDNLALLAAAQWVPDGVGGLDTILTSNALGPQEIVDLLNVNLPVALGLLRGETPVTAEQAAVLAGHIPPLSTTSWRRTPLHPSRCASWSTCRDTARRSTASRRNAGPPTSKRTGPPLTDRGPWLPGRPGWSTSQCGSTDSTGTSRWRCMSSPTRAQVHAQTQAMYEVLDTVLPGVSDGLRDDPVAVLQAHPELAVKLVREIESNDGCSVSGAYHAAIESQLPTIAIGTSRSQGRRAFTALHELGHHLQQNNIHLVRALCAPGVDSHALEEGACDEFAVRLLLPEDVVAAHIGSKGPTADDVAALARATPRHGPRCVCGRRSCCPAPVTSCS